MNMSKHCAIIKNFLSNFSRIKYVGHSKVNVRGQEIVRFEIEASSKKNKKNHFPEHNLWLKKEILFYSDLIYLTLSYWLSASLLIGEKPFEIKVLEEEEQQELNENLISAQILASQLDRVFTLFQENLALSKADSLADDASLPFLNNLTDMLEELDIKLLGIKPKATYG